MYLDCDTTPPLKSQYLRVRKATTAVKIASGMLRDSRAVGQIGVYAGNPVLAEGFAGYVIRNENGRVYFEEARRE